MALPLAGSMDLSQRLCPAAINPFALCERQLFPDIDNAFAVVAESSDTHWLSDQTTWTELSCSFHVEPDDVDRLLSHEAYRERQADAFWRRAELHCEGAIRQLANTCSTAAHALAISASAVATTKQDPVSERGAVRLPITQSPVLNTHNDASRRLCIHHLFSPIS